MTHYVFKSILRCIIAISQVLNNISHMNSMIYILMKGHICNRDTKFESSELMVVCNCGPFFRLGMCIPIAGMCIRYVILCWDILW